MIYILYEDDEGNISVEGKISIDNHGVINEFYNSKKFTYNFENLNFQVKYRGQVRKIFNIIKNRWIYIYNPWYKNGCTDGLIIHNDCIEEELFIETFRYEEIINKYKIETRDNKINTIINES